jgi:hypothetical protein
MSVEILNRKRVGEYFQYTAAVDGKKLSDSVSVPAEYILTRTESEAQAFVEKQVRGVARMLAEQERGELEVFR